MGRWAMNTQLRAHHMRARLGGPLTERQHGDDGGSL